jgi:ferritin-like metal-binding protein YciE
MKEMQTLEDLFWKEASVMRVAENQFVRALPDIMREVVSAELKEALQQQLEEAKEQSRRLEEFLGEAGRAVEEQSCPAVESLLKEISDLLSSGGDLEVQEVAIICAVQKIKHFEIATYGCLRTFATLLELDEMAAFLAQSLDEEKNADALLTSIAEAKVNLRAMPMQTVMR